MRELWALAAALSLASGARAGELEDARENIERLAREHVSKRAADGWLIVEKSGGGRQSLKIKRFTGDVRPKGGGVYGGLFELAVKGGGVVHAEFEAKFTGVFKVTGLRLLSRKAAAKLRAEAARAPAPAKEPAGESFTRTRVAAASGPGPLGQLDDSSLPTLGGSAASPADCPVKKCVTVYLAPWCPHCQSVGPAVLELRRLVAGRGVDVRVIVGMDESSKIAEYAASFGPGTMLDEDGVFKPSGGVPNFTVSVDGGGVYKRLAGAPGGGGGQGLADYLGL